MRKIAFSVLAISSIIGCTAAMAADLPPAAPLPPRAPAAYIPAPPPFTWTGFYVGINGGYGWNKWSDSFGDNFNGSGGIVGGTIGFNYQISQFVVGVDADFDWANVKWSQSGLIAGPFGGFAGVTITDKDEFLSTFAARFGYAFDHALLYAKAGGAWTRENLSASVTAVGGGVATGSSDFNRLGWMVGGGLEYAVTNNITVKAEYNYINFSNTNENITLSGGGLAAATLGPLPVKQTMNVVKVGVNYLFNSY